MTIWIWLFFWKFWEYDYLQYDYYFRKSEIWLFAIWLFFEKIWRNMTICNTSNIFSFDDSRIIWNFAGKTSLSGAILVSFLLAVEVIRGIWFPEKPLSLNSHIQKYDYLNMTIILKNIKYDYLQYDYFFEIGKIWLFVIWLFFWKNSHISRKKYD